MACVHAHARVRLVDAPRQRVDIVHFVIKTELSRGRIGKITSAPRIRHAYVKLQTSLSVSQRGYIS